MELAWDQPFPRVNCVPQFPMPESCNLCKAHGVPVARQEQGHCQHPADSAALEILQHCQNHPQAALEKKGSITASALQKEKQRGHRSSIKIQSRSTRLSDSQTLFMGTRHPPHTAHVSSTENQDLTLQRLGDIFLRSSLFVISTNWERLWIF